MRRFLPLSALLLLPLPVTAGEDEIPYRGLLLRLDDLKNDTVTYEAPFLGFTRNAPPFLEAEGVEDEKDVILTVGSMQLPVVSDFDEVEELLAEIPRNSIVRVTGKLRKARRDPSEPRTSGYYLELDLIEIVPDSRPPRNETERPVRPGRPAE